MDIEECSNLLDHYERVALTLHECHKRYALLYQKISNIFTIVNIILGTITGTSSISIYNKTSPNFQLMNIIFVYMITILTSLYKIIDPSTKYEKFRNASDEYLSLFYKIKFKTTFDLRTEEELKIFVKDLNIKLEDMRVKFPFINDGVYDNIKHKTTEKLLKTRSLETRIQIENNITKE